MLLETWQWRSERERDREPGDRTTLPVSRRKPIRGGLLEIAVGETSAHHHVVSAADAALIEEGSRIILAIMQETAIEVRSTATGESQPERHRPIRLMPGSYEVRVQREYVNTPAGMPMRTTRVRD